MSFIAGYLLGLGDGGGAQTTFFEYIFTLPVDFEYILDSHFKFQVRHTDSGIGTIIAYNQRTPELIVDSMGEYNYYYNCLLYDNEPVLAIGSLSLCKSLETYNNDGVLISRQELISSTIDENSFGYGTQANSVIVNLYVDNSFKTVDLTTSEETITTNRQRINASYNSVYVFSGYIRGMYIPSQMTFAKMLEVNRKLRELWETL